jgi:hypothetical protein
MIGYRLTVERPTFTGTRAWGINGPPESGERGEASVMVIFGDGADLGSSVMAVRSIFELRKRDAQHNNQRDDTRWIEANLLGPTAR